MGSSLSASFFVLFVAFVVVSDSEFFLSHLGYGSLTKKSYEKALRKRYESVAKAQRDQGAKRNGRQERPLGVVWFFRWGGCESLYPIKYSLR